ncbi:MAG TPA: O-antigen ligase family protein [Vicinamibacterales bacterium]|jgi:O-antigen ligase|nr:O-antigen ligase family protein [Vicinamibacterales bacterium]
MTSATVTMAPPHPAPTLDRIATWLLLLFVASLQMSIFAAQILLTLMLICWVALLARDRARPSAPAFLLPLLIYGVLTLVSSAFALDPWESFKDDKQLVLLIVVPAVYDLARGRRSTTVLDVVITVAAIGAVYGIVQYGLLHFDSLGKRPQGISHHYMTFSGFLMLGISAVLARLVFGSRDRMWPALLLPALIVALFLTLGRGAWVGTSIAVAVILSLKDFRLIAAIPVVVAVAFALAPDTVTRRMTSVFDLKDPSNRDRVSMLQTGVAMIRAHPLTGVGPNMVEKVYVQYRAPGAVEPVNQHLHNVPIQIAAERGIPALIVFLWFVVSLARSLMRMFRDAENRVLAATGIAALVAMLAAGMFEYNFGDSEFLMLFLVLITLPFAALRSDAPPATPS